MRNQPRPLLPLIHAVGSAEDVVRHLTTVSESLMEAIETGNTPVLTENDRDNIRYAELWLQMAGKYLTEFKGGMDDDNRRNPS